MTVSAFPFIENRIDLIEFIYGFREVIIDESKYEDYYISPTENPKDQALIEIKRILVEPINNSWKEHEINDEDFNKWLVDHDDFSGMVYTLNYSDFSDLFIKKQIADCLLEHISFDEMLEVKAKDSFINVERKVTNASERAERTRELEVVLGIYVSYWERILALINPEPWQGTLNDVENMVASEVENLFEKQICHLLDRYTYVSFTGDLKDKLEKIQNIQNNKNELDIEYAKQIILKCIPNFNFSDRFGEFEGDMVKLLFKDVSTYNKCSFVSGGTIEKKAYYCMCHYLGIVSHLEDEYSNDNQQIGNQLLVLFQLSDSTPSSVVAKDNFIAYYNHRSNSNNHKYPFKKYDTNTLNKLKEVYPTISFLPKPN